MSSVMRDQAIKSIANVTADMAKEWIASLSCLANEADRRIQEAQDSAEKLRIGRDREYQAKCELKSRLDELRSRLDELRVGVASQDLKTLIDAVCSAANIPGVVRQIWYEKIGWDQEVEK